MNLYLIAIALYLGFLIFVSYTKSRKVETQEDFMVAGRGVTATFLVGTLVCTWIGSGSLFGGAGRAFRSGFSALWFSAGAWIGLAIVYYLAPRVRKVAEFTVPDILEKRYNPAARLLGMIAIVIAYLTIAGYQFIGGGRLISILTDGAVDPKVGQFIVAGLVVLFTILAGMSSIVAMDLFNGALITLGVLLAAPFALKAAGGWSQLTTTLPETHFTTFGTFGAASALGLFLPTFLLLLGESSIYQKFMSAKDGATARRAVIGMIIGVILVETVLDSVAIFGAGVYWNDAGFREAGEISKAASETVILQLGAEQLPALIGIVLLIGAAAIIFSTANTFLMVPSTNVARDVYQRFINPQASERAIIRFQRVMIAVLAMVALLVTTQFTSILAMALYAYTMVGAAVTPALLAAFLWKRATPAGGTASIAVGILSTVVFALLVNVGGMNFDWGFIQINEDTAYDYIIYPAFLLSVLALVGVSLLTPKPDESKWRPFAPGSTND